ncbi:prepilin-type N-terminal cleavage/methylation domain-containing protein [Rhizobium sp. YIM 134829]|uniref:type IV pilus modification PilV family protein n=1 Tax=Rhizobium sp. YIM 134829 TaxID=3390453 RepID=UPI00397D021D
MSPSSPMTPKPGGRLAGRDGFTLIEVLVAFLVLAATMIALQKAVSTSVQMSARVDERMRAQHVAESLMTAPLGAGAIGEQSGTLDGLRWTIALRRLDLPFPTAVAMDGTRPKYRPVRVLIAVSLPSGGALRVEVVRLLRETST